MKKILLICLFIISSISLLKGQPPANHCDDCDGLQWTDYGSTLNITVSDIEAFPEGCEGCEIEVNFRWRAGLCNGVNIFEIQIYNIGFNKPSCDGCYTDLTPPLDPEDRINLISRIAERVILARALRIDPEEDPIFDNPSPNWDDYNFSDWITFRQPACWMPIQDDANGYRQGPCNNIDCCVDSYKLFRYKDHYYYENWSSSVKIGLRSTKNESDLSCNYPPPYDNCSNKCVDFRLKENDLIGPFKYTWPIVNVIDLNPVKEFEISQMSDNIFINYKSDVLGLMNIDIYNVSGVLMKRLNFFKNSYNYSTNIIDFNIPTGVYFLKITIGNLIFYISFINI